MSTAIYTYSATSMPEVHDWQRAECEALTRELGHTITLTYRDERGARSALEQLLTDARENKVSALVVARLDRLGRRVATLAPVMEALRDGGVTVYAADHGEVRVSESPMLGIMRAVADHEDEHTEDEPEEDITR